MRRVREWRRCLAGASTIPQGRAFAVLHAIEQRRRAPRRWPRSSPSSSATRPRLSPARRSPSTGASSRRRGLRQLRGRGADPRAARRRPGSAPPRSPAGGHAPHPAALRIFRIPGSRAPAPPIPRPWVSLKREPPPAAGRRESARRPPPRSRCCARSATGTTSSFFAGQLVSLVGTWMQCGRPVVARLPADGAVGALLGIVGFATQIPVFLLAPIGGTVADRRSRHCILLATQSAAMALAFGSRAHLERASRSRRISASSAPRRREPFDIPTRQAFVVEGWWAGGGRTCQRAIALNSSMLNGARISARRWRASSSARSARGWCFIANGVSFLARAREPPGDAASRPVRPPPGAAPRSLIRFEASGSSRAPGPSARSSSCSGSASVGDARTRC